MCQQQVKGESLTVQGTNVKQSMDGYIKIRLN